MNNGSFESKIDEFSAKKSALEAEDFFEIDSKFQAKIAKQFKRQ
jgi:hypothetical protein